MRVSILLTISYLLSDIQLHIHLAACQNHNNHGGWLMLGLLRRAVLLGASGVALCLGGQAARASVPLPGDAVQPPANINILLYYNVLDGAGEMAPVRGNGYDKNTRISADFQAIRYIHTFNVAGMVGGVQLYQVYSNFLGPQEIGIPNLGGLGSGRARLRHGEGLAQVVPHRVV